MRGGDRRAEHVVVTVHGGIDRAEVAALGVDAARVVDFSVNTNPYGPCAAVRDAIAAATIDRYPDPTAREARAAIAAMAGVTRDEVALGNGAAELLWTLVRALPHEPAVLVEPTFGEPRAALEAVGATIISWPARFAIDLPAIASTVRAHRARLVYLCTPNTPTGATAPATDVAEFATSLGGAALILDQSFLSLSDRAADAAVAMPPNVVRVRSLTKDHGIPGVRVGYAIATPPVIALLDAHRPAWTTGAHAQAAAIAACTAGARAFVAESARRLLADRAALDVALASLGLAPVPSSTVFTLVPVRDAAALRRRLLVRHSILVRDCASFGVPDHIRIAARPAADRAHLIAALAEELP